MTETSTVVIQQDRKGRLTDLVVNGERVDVATAGKKRRGKREPTQTITVATPLTPPAPAPLGLSTDVFSAGAFDADSEAMLANMKRQAHSIDSLRKIMPGMRMRFEFNAPNSTRRDTARSKRMRINSFSFEVKPDQEDVRQRTWELKLKGNRASQSVAEQQRQMQRRVELAGRLAEANARLAEAGTRQGEANVRRGEARMRQQQSEDRQRERLFESGEAAARRAELRARVAEARARLNAREAELRALDVEADAAGSRQGPGLPPMPPPPAPDANRLREALRRDGLLGAKEKNFSFELNNDGARLNGRALTPAQAAKYRQLLSPGSGRQGSKSNISITISEN